MNTYYHCAYVLIVCVHQQIVSFVNTVRSIRVVNISVVIVMLRHIAYSNVYYYSIVGLTCWLKIDCYTRMHLGRKHFEFERQLF